MEVPAPEPDAERQRLLFERRLNRERAARQEAEAITERITRQLFERNQALELLTAVADVGIQSLSTEEAFSRALNAVCDALGWDVATIELLDPEASRELRSAFSGRSASSSLGQVDRLLGHPVGLMSEILLHDRACWVAELHGDERFADLSWHDDLLGCGVRALLGIPIYFNETIQAVLLLAHGQPKSTDQRQIELLGQICIQFGYMVERDLRQRQLVQARVAAESALQARNEFLAVISHEMRTPMNGVLGMAQLALNSGLTERQQDYIRTILRSGERMMEMVSMLLDMANLSAGRMQLNAHMFSIHEQLTASVLPFKKLADRKKVEFILSIGPEVPELLIGDPVRFGQVVAHVVGNAIKFTEVGKVVTTVSASVNPVSGDCLVTVVVTDTGIGIADEKRADIFEAFRQGDGSSTRSHEGAGLGLTLSLKLVEMMGGTISVDSRLGEGSRFSFSIPFKQH